MLLKSLSEKKPVHASDLDLKTFNRKLACSTKDNDIASFALCVQRLSIGSLDLLFLPGEPFIEIAQELESSAAPRDCIVSGYSNQGEIGYIPTREAIEEGGYECDAAPYPYKCTPETVQGLMEWGKQCIRS